MVTDCDRGMPFVMSHPESEAAKAFKQIADRNTSTYPMDRPNLNHKTHLHDLPFSLMSINDLYTKYINDSSVTEKNGNLDMIIQSMLAFLSVISRDI
jgi:hypothetical protein